MSRPLVLGLAAFVATFLIAHFLVLSALPGRIMSAVQERIIEGGMAVNAWTMSPQITPETQTIVRPSPDLAYAICLIDLSEGPVLLEVPAWPDYGSLSIFDTNTDNVYAGSLDARMAGTPQMRRVILGLESHELYRFDQDAEQIVFKRPKALALIRRLAPTPWAWEEAASLLPESRCGPV